MSPSRLLILLLAAALVVPAYAHAAPPDNDDYVDSIRINQPNTVLPDDYEDASITTTEATTEDELLGPGSDGEVTRCDFANGRQVHYGKTVWWDFFPDVDGEVLLEAGPFDAVIGLVPWDFGTGEPFYDEWVCADHPSLQTRESAVFGVQAGRSYSIQIGGYAGEGSTPGTPASGDLEFAFTFFPDTDGDGVLDQDDNCVNTPGLTAFQGCPDADGDGVPEPPDACPGVKGNLANGCASAPPRPDSDQDGVFDDGPDKCVGEDSRARDENTNGCLDLRTFSPTWIFTPDTYFVRRGGRVVLLGLTVKRLGVSGVPKGARVVVRCTRGECGRMTKRANSRVFFPQLKGEDLRAGAKVTIRVTAPGYVGRARVYTIGRNEFARRINRCLMPGSARLRTTCSPVR